MSQAQISLPSEMVMQAEFKNTGVIQTAAGEAIIDAEINNNYIINTKIDKGGYSEDENTVAAGKALVASAISKQGVPASSGNSFNMLAEKIGQLSPTTQKGSRVVSDTKIESLKSTSSITVTAEVG